jgi:predicted transglutaminase-like cysteine proteinase
MGGCSTGPEPSSPLPLGLPTETPAGYAAMCARSPSECPSAQAEAGARLVPARSSLELSAERWKQLNDVNYEINSTVRYVSDEEQYGVAEYWTPAYRAGNCKDYALAKRDLLWAEGWPVGSLSIALVYSPRTGSHAVLIASTSQGAYVLDNTVGWIRSWDETDYTWNAAQDTDGVWRTAGPNAQAALQVALFTARARAVRATTTLASAVVPAVSRQE